MKRIGILIITIGSLLISCKEKDKGTETNTSFDQAQILEQLATNYIVPGYDSLHVSLLDLKSSWNTFLTNSTDENLARVQANWKRSYIHFDRMKMFEFGPAMNVGLAAALGTFPSDTAQIESNIVAENVNLQTATNIDAVGFNALDYLLFNKNKLNAIKSDVKTKNYVAKLMDKMFNEVELTKNDWKQYKSTFVKGTGSSSTSPFALFINAYCKDFELLKNAKIGFPNGTQSLGVPLYEYLEAKYAGIGKIVLIENAKALHAVFNGNGYNNSSGIGLRAYLDALSKSDLANTIDERLNYLHKHPESWSGSIRENIEMNQQKVTDYYAYIQATTVFLKTDMTGAFGVLITYQDNDGD